MTAFLSQRPNNDPFPMVGKDRYPANVTPDGTPLRFDPRPEYDHTGDPQPWFSAGHQWSEQFKREIEASGVYWGQPWEWAPRREQFDVPVNVYLAAYRSYVQDFGDDDLSEARIRSEELDNLFKSPAVQSISKPQIDHARRVLAKLVNVYGGA